MALLKCEHLRQILKTFLPELQCIRQAVYHRPLRKDCLKPCNGCQRLMSLSVSGNLPSHASITRRVSCVLNKGYQRPVVTSCCVYKDDKVTDAGQTTGEELTSKKAKVKTIIKVQPTMKNKQKIDRTQSYYDNIFITPIRAMDEYLLSIRDLDSLTKIKRRSAYTDIEVMTVFLRREVEKRAIEVHGSLEALTRERQKRVARDRMQHALDVFNVKRARREYLRQHEDERTEKPFIFSAPAPSAAVNTLFSHGSGKVVLYAITVNLANCVLKGGAWIYTGSHSMFAECVHSAADTANQILLAIGLNQSLKKPDPEHPYGWASFNNVSSLISGVSIFCMGAGLSWYHGIMGLIHPTEVMSLYWGILILLGSFVSEGATLLVAANQVRLSAKAEKMNPLQYVWTGNDPSTNVVLLEDLGAVAGVAVAATCMSITYFTGNPIADAIGSLLVGTILSVVASFIIYTNTIALVGRSIPLVKKQILMKELEGDRMIRALHDVKATDIGSSHVRFKAEVDFDGREITRYYLERQDMDGMLQELRALENIEELEAFMLRHGEAIVDTLGCEVDRIEQTLKNKHPEIRHVDLEQL